MNKIFHYITTGQPWIMMLQWNRIKVTHTHFSHTDMSQEFMEKHDWCWHLCRPALKRICLQRRKKSPSLPFSQTPMLWLVKVGLLTYGQSFLSCYFKSHNIGVWKKGGREILFFLNRCFCARQACIKVNINLSFSYYLAT